MEYRNMQDFLNRCGVLEEGTPEEIREAKKTYRKMYMREYKKRKRRESKEVTLLMNRKKYKELYRMAKDNGMALSAFIIGVVEGKSFVPSMGMDRDAIAGIAVWLAKVHSELTHMADKSGKETDFTILRDRVLSMENLSIKIFRGESINDELARWNVRMDGG